MSETKLLNFTVHAVASDYLELQIKNLGGAPLDQSLDIEIQLPDDQVDTRIRKSVEAARTSQMPRNMASLTGVVTVGAGLSIWALKEESPKIAAIRALNYLDQNAGTALAVPTKVAADAVFSLRIPLTQQSKPAQVTVAYKYKHGGRKSPWINGSLEFTTAGGGQWEPKVSLTLDQPNSTMLEPAQKVTISWEISDGVSATLRGPLPGGHSQLTLSKDPKSDFWIEKGGLEIYAVGPATYMLDAEVRRAKNQPTVQVIRTLLLDTKSVNQYASLRVRPNRVLPNGQVDIDWAVWGVESVTLRIEERSSVTLTLTEQDANHTYQGTGVWSERAQNHKEDVELIIDNFEPKYGKISVAQWQKTTRPKYTGKPLGLAVAATHMALLTSDGLFIADVGKTDGPSNNPDFHKVTPNTPRDWQALTAFGDGFVALWQTPQYGLQLAHYNSEGKLQGVPIDIPNNFVDLVLRRPGATIDLVALGERVYFVAEARLPGGSLREVYAVRFGAHEGVQHEPLLSQLSEYELLTIAGGLYGLHRSAGQMLRFDHLADRDIEDAWKAASAVNKGGQSLVRTGLLLPVDNLLVVLDPGDFSSPKPVALSNQVNVSDFDFTTQQKNAKEAPQDLVYNPQKDEWTGCGHGLEIKQGAVAAFRGGGSKRLWVLQPDGEMHTLMEATAKLFTPKYVDKFPPAVLPPALNAKRVFQIRNNSEMDLVSMGSGPIFSGLSEVSSTGLVDVEPAPRMTLRRGLAEVFTIRYHKADPQSVKLRYLVPHETQFLDYFLEVTFSGPDLTSVTSVFKRVTEDRAGVVTITPMLDTLVHYAADRPLDDKFLRDWRRNHKGEPDPERPVGIPPAKRLLDRTTKLILVNNSAYELVRSTDNMPFRTYREQKVEYTTPSFSINALPADNYRRLGELRFDINFALPHGIETSSGSLPQQSLLRINADQAKGLEVKLAKRLNPGDPSIEVGYRMNDEEKKLAVSADKGVVYVCQIVSTK
jgi:hypothetical protein